jgi:hypothetical protein
MSSLLRTEAEMPTELSAIVTGCARRGARTTHLSGHEGLVEHASLQWGMVEAQSAAGATAAARR